MKSHIHSRSGVALVIVLGFLVLLSALAVAFFSSVTTELKASRNFASGVSTRQLSESAVSVVMGQVRDATSKQNGAWASQPGMIRVYRSGSSASADADSFYKLYSSNNMVVTKSDLEDFVKMADYSKEWDKSPALWTDLNSPVWVRESNTSHAARFPIIDPSAKNEVEGFDFTTEGKVDVPKTAGTIKNSDAVLPMPVRWIYVLQDGTMTTPLDGTGSQAKWADGSAKSPTKENPIVGRIAFWADDETSKVNLNTAGGHITATNALPPAYQSYPDKYAGSYWDTPRFYTEFDRGMPNRETASESGPEDDRPGRPVKNQASGGLALCQLLQNEFQRYPGHPATTSLGMLFTDKSTNQSVLTSEQLYSVLPRLGITNKHKGSPGSSQGGTKRVVKGKDLPSAAPDELQIQPKQDRLYSSVDELVFAAKSGLASDVSYKRRKNDVELQETDVITPAFVDKFRFFMTAQSRAPELNLFGQPRVTIWPVRHEGTTGASGLNAFDNVILFCSTIGSAATPGTRPDTTTVPPTGPFRYIFTRKEVVPGTDTNATGTFTAGFTQDIDRPRNKQLMEYLKKMTDRNIPGFGESFQTKYGTPNRVSLLTQIFDFIRCANTRDTTTTISGGVPIKFAQRGIIKPSEPTYLGGGSPKGFGRFPTINEATLVFYYAGPKMNNTAGDVPIFPGSPTKVANTSWSKWDSTAPNRKVAFIDKGPGGLSNPDNKPNRLMRVFVLFSTFNPMQGYAPYTNPAGNDPKLTIQVEGLNAMAVTGAISGGLTFPAGKLSTTITQAPGSSWGGRNFGGYEGFMHTLDGGGTAGSKYKIAWAAGPSKLLAADYGESTGLSGSPTSYKNPFVNPVVGAPTAAQFDQQEYYPFQSGLPAAEFPWNVSTFGFQETDLKVTLFYGGVEVQSLSLKFPAATWPVPKGDPAKIPSADGKTTADVTTWLATNTTPATPGGATGPGDPLMKNYYWTERGAFFSDVGAVRPGTTKPTNYKYETSLQASWSFATRLSWAMLHSHNPSVNASKAPINYYTDRWRCIVQPGDTVKSLIYWDRKNASGGDFSGINAIKSGDLRVALLTKDIPTTQFERHPDYLEPNSRATLLRTGSGAPYFHLGALAATPFGASPNLEGTFGNHVALTGVGYPVGGQRNRFPATNAFGNLPWRNASGVNGVVRADGQPGDFDTGIGSFADGPYSNKPDEGNVIVAYFDTHLQRWIYPIPYYGTWAYEEPGNTYTSPFRQMPSAIMMGSLLSRAAEGKHWETLSFSPRPAGTGHPGNVEPKDHLLLDLFHMPIVEPYPISEPFSTAGKVNLNYKIMPFDYITRSTALRATLHPVRVTAVPSTHFNEYKTGKGTAPANTYDADRGQAPPSTANYRNPVERDATINEFEKVFAEGLTNPNKGFFKVPSQICEVDLYPEIDMPLAQWWSLRGLTGDNMREKPYADLYPRITTKSNTYTVHMRVQTLRQLPRIAADGFLTWEEGKDAVLGEYRGSTTIERYIDPADPRLTQGHPEFVNPDEDSIEKLYRFRTVMNKKFTPQ